MSAARRVTVRASGHPQLRGTHHKSLEITREEAVTGRATCVVGVAAGEFPPELHLLRGPVRITVAAGPGARLAGHAVINPDHRVDRRLVVRRSDRVDPDTLANRADFTAADLDPALRAALSQPGAPVTMDIEEVRAPPPLVLVNSPAAGPLPGRWGWLWRYADASVSFGAGMAGSAGADLAAALRSVTAGGVVAASVSAPLDQAPARAIGWLVAAAEHGARLLAPAADATTGTLLAAGLAPAPAVRLGTVDRRSVRRPAIAGLLRHGPVPVVLTLALADAEPVLGPLATGEAGSRPVAVPAELVDVGVQLQWTTLAAALPRLAGSGGDPVTIVLGSREQATAPVELADLARSLLAAGVPARSLAEALRGWGVGRAEVYRWRQQAGPPAPSN